MIAIFNLHCRLIPILILLAFFTSCSPASYDPGQGEVWDPIEPVNRKVFWFNDKFDTYILEPIAKGYDYILPDSAQRSVTNFLENLNYPIYLLSDLVQLKFDQVGVHTSRFAINSTVGILGLFDPAEEWGFAEHSENFGTALGYWGVGPGPYLVLPFLGPSNGRDLTGFAVDSFISPTQYLIYADVRDDVRFPIFYSLLGLKTVNSRANLLDVLGTGKEGSVDFYTFIKSSYNSSRNNVIFDLSEQELEFDDEEFED